MMTLGAWALVSENVMKLAVVKLSSTTTDLAQCISEFVIWFLYCGMFLSVEK